MKALKEMPAYAGPFVLPADISQVEQAAVQPFDQADPRFIHLSVGGWLLKVGYVLEDVWIALTWSRLMLLCTVEQRLS